MTPPRFIRRVIFWLILAGRLLPGNVPAVEYSGQVSVENYYLNDTISAQDFDFLRMRLRFDVFKLDEAGRLSFHFPGASAFA